MYQPACERTVVQVEGELALELTRKMQSMASHAFFFSRK